jgi:hypothetical protein
MIRFTHLDRRLSTSVGKRQRLAMLAAMVAVVAASVAVITPGAAKASFSILPGQASTYNDLGCDNGKRLDGTVGPGTVFAWAPVMAPQYHGESIAFVDYLYRWTGTQWQYYRASQSFSTRTPADIFEAGLVGSWAGRWPMGNGASYGEWDFFNLPHGWYKVVQVMVWGGGNGYSSKSITDYATTASNSTMCLA